MYVKFTLINRFICDFKQYFMQHSYLSADNYIRIKI